MAFTYDTTTTSARSRATPAVTFTHTCGASAKLLLLSIVVAGSADRTGGAPTYNGATMTQVATNGKAAISPETVVELWYLINPGTGSAYTVSVPDSGNNYLTMQATSFNQGDATKLILVRDSETTSNTSTNPTSKSYSSLVSGDLMYAVVGNGATTWAPSARTGTQVYDVDDGSYGDGAQYLIKADANNTAMAWTFGTSEDWALVSVVFKLVTGYSLSITYTGYTLTNQTTTLSKGRTLSATTLVLTLITAGSAPEVIYSDYYNGNSGSPVGWDFTVPSDTNTLIVAFFSTRAQDSSYTTVTLGGTALTSLGSTSYDTGDNPRVEIHYMVNPPTGTQHIEFSTANNMYMTYGFAILKNVNQSTPLRDITTWNSAPGSNIYTGTVTNTSSGSELVLAAVSHWDNTGAASPGSGQTAIYSYWSDGSWRGAASYKAGASSVTSTWTANSQTSTLTDRWAVAATSVYGSAAGCEVNLVYTSVTKVVADQASFSIASQTVGLKVSRVLGISNSSFTLAPQDVNFAKGRILSLAKTDFTLSRQVISFAKTYVVPITQADFALTFEDASLAKSAQGQLAISVVNFSLLPQTASLISSGKRYFQQIIHFI